MRHASELRAAGRIRRAVEQRVMERFIACGDPHHGFARIYCDACCHDYLLAYSCKTRYFCPSCHQKRVLVYGEWLEENVLEPAAHRQYVFTVPRLLRPIFAQHRAWLGTGTVIYRSKMHLGLKRNFQVMPGAEWLQLLLRHVPDRYEHLVRYVGWYSNRARGERAKDRNERAAPGPCAASAEIVSELARRAKAAWARLIRNEPIAPGY